MILNRNEIEKLPCKRAGIIPYIVKDGIYFLMGVDKRTGQFSDFGGGIKNGETPILAGIRELYEETKQLIKEDDLEEIKVGIFDRPNATCIIFCKIRDWTVINSLCDQFKRQNMTGDEYNEMSDLIWLSEDEMIRHVYSEHSNIWQRIRYSLLNSGEFDESFLYCLKN